MLTGLDLIALEEQGRIGRTRDFRIDDYLSNGVDITDPERQKRVKEHRKRVKNELN